MYEMDLAFLTGKVHVAAKWDHSRQESRFDPTHDETRLVITHSETADESIFDVFRRATLAEATRITASRLVSSTKRISQTFVATKFRIGSTKPSTQSFHGGTLE